MELKNWYFVKQYYPASLTIDVANQIIDYYIMGDVYNDENMRFPDGYRIQTSKIIGKIADNKVVTKSGSVYELNEPADPSASTDSIKILTDLPIVEEPAPRKMHNFGKTVKYVGKESNLLENGKSYEVYRVTVNAWDTEIRLTSFPNNYFNSVDFV